MQGVNIATKNYIEVEIADVSRQIYTGRCMSLAAPAALGEVCILPRHAPFLSKLRPGEIRLETDQNEHLCYYVSGGYLEVKNSMVTVLADQMLRSAEIDKEAALAAKASAELTLKTSRVESERDVARIELLKALAQLQVLECADLTKLRKLRR